MTKISFIVVAYNAAQSLDALLGEPPALWSRLPHPAVLMGRLIGMGFRTERLG